MKVRIEFDTNKPAHTAKIYIDDKLQEYNIFNVHLILEPLKLPVFTYNLRKELLDILRWGYERAIKEQVAETL